MPIPSTSVRSTSLSVSGSSEESTDTPPPSGSGSSIEGVELAVEIARLPSEAPAEEPTEGWGEWLAGQLSLTPLQIRERFYIGGAAVAGAVYDSSSPGLLLGGGLGFVVSRVSQALNQRNTTNTLVATAVTLTAGLTGFVAAFNEGHSPENSALVGAAAGTFVDLAADVVVGQLMEHAPG